MSVRLETISSSERTKRKAKRLGRGNGSGKGTYAARGLKGQKARSGGKGGLQLKGFKQGLLKVPKLRGFKSNKPKPATVTLAMLEQHTAEGEVITPQLLAKKKLISDPSAGVKIVATGTLTKKVQLKGCLASKGALEAIEQAGGKVGF